MPNKLVEFGLLLCLLGQLDRRPSKAEARRQDPRLLRVDKIDTQELALEQCVAKLSGILHKRCPIPPFELVRVPFQTSNFAIKKVHSPDVLILANLKLLTFGEANYTNFVDPATRDGILISNNMKKDAQLWQKLVARGLLVNQPTLQVCRDDRVEEGRRIAHQRRLLIFWRFVDSKPFS